MWHNDPIFAKILQSRMEVSPFRKLPSSICVDDTVTPERLHEAFVRVFRSEHARAGRNVVFIWSVEEPYTHTDGHRLQSTVVNIEKTVSTIAGRWSVKSLANLVQDFDKIKVADPNNLRQLANGNRNFSFYRRLIKEHGPLSIWWCEAHELDKSSGLDFAESRKWEQALICAYWQEYECFPLKNRQC